MNAKKKPMLEREVERRVCEYAQKTYGMCTFKWSSPNQRGVPDRIFITQQGLVAFIEFKAEGKRGHLSPTQKSVLDRLTDYHCEVFIIDNVESGRQLVDLISDAATYATIRYGRAKDLIVPASVSASRH